MTQAGTWAIVLAAGDGTRLAPVTTQSDGTVVPKQYFDFGDGASLLDGTLARARGVAHADRVMAVVAETHRPWWETGLRSLKPANVIVQPSNRGTAAGLLLPLLNLYYRDPDAVVVVLPSDQHVGREDVLRAAMDEAVRVAREDESRVLLLGVTPDAPESDYGWILANPGPAGSARGVAAFVEKPERARAQRLMEFGALWSSFMMTGHVGAFVHLFARHAPGLLRSMLGALAPGGTARPTARLESLYAALESRDFSRDVLQEAGEDLAVLAVPPCGWSDLGTPARVAEWQSARSRRGLALPVGA